MYAQNFSQDRSRGPRCYQFPRVAPFRNNRKGCNADVALARHTTHVVHVAQEYDQHGAITAAPQFSRLRTEKHACVAATIMPWQRSGRGYSPCGYGHDLMPSRLREAREGSREHKGKDKDYADSIRTCGNCSLNGESVEEPNRHHEESQDYGGDHHRHASRDSIAVVVVDIFVVGLVSGLLSRDCQTAKCGQSRVDLEIVLTLGQKKNCQGLSTLHRHKISET